METLRQEREESERRESEMATVSGNNVDAAVSGQRTPSILPSQLAETEEPDADVHESDLFASAESENIATTSCAEAQRSLFNFRTNYGKIRRLRPRQLGYLEKDETSYSHVLMLDRGVASDSDDDDEFQLTIFADRAGSEFAAWSRKRCVLCKHHVHGKPLSQYTMRLNMADIDPDRQYPHCGATTTIGGDIVCLKCTRTHVWLLAENWLIQSREDAEKAWSVSHREM
eukprot:4028102-Amphidinium_carterae.1